MQNILKELDDCLLAFQTSSHTLDSLIHELYFSNVIGYITLEMQQPYKNQTLQKVTYLVEEGYVREEIDDEFGGIRYYITIKGLRFIARAGKTPRPYAHQAKQERRAQAWTRWKIFAVIVNALFLLFFAFLQTDWGKSIFNDAYQKSKFPHDSTLIKQVK